MTPLTKKIIYIGSEPPRDNLQTYNFTVREMYRYCTIDNRPIGFTQYYKEPKITYSEPEITYLDFLWLDERKSELENILETCAQNDESLTDNLQQKFIRKLLAPFANASFNSQKLDALKEKYDYEKIGDMLDLETKRDTIDAICDWYGKLSFDGENPKMEYMNHAKSQNNDIICLSKGASFKNILKKCAVQQPKVIFDALAHHAQYDDRYKYLLRYCLYADVEALYYEGHEKFLEQSLQKFISKEFELYKGRLRNEWKTSVEFHEEASHENRNQEMLLEDFFDNEKSYSDVYDGETRRYRVQFTDGTSEDLTGDVLRLSDGNTPIPLFDLCSEYKEEEEILFYKNPDDWEAILSQAIGNESLESKVNKYANLWKNSFIESYRRRRCNCRTDNETIETIYKDINEGSTGNGLRRSLVKKYSQENDHQFLKEKQNMEEMCDFLIREKLISKEDKRYIMASKKFTESSSKFGRELKQLVFALYRGMEVPEKLKEYWENLKGSYTKEKIIGLTCRIKKIKNITEL